MTTLTDLLEQYGALSFEKQLALGDLIGDRNWQADLTAGTITFGSDYTFPIQMLGTESEYDGTWLWAWANDASNIPPALLQCCTTMRQLGATQNIPELTTPELSLQTTGGHTLSMIASGVCNASAYYRGPYQGGAAFMLITSPSLALPTPPVLPRVITTFLQFVSAVPVNHKRAFSAYATARGLTLTPTSTGLIASLGNSHITAVFDNLDRLAKIDSTLSPS